MATEADKKSETYASQYHDPNVAHFVKEAYRVGYMEGRLSRDAELRYEVEQAYMKGFREGAQRHEKD